MDLVLVNSINIGRIVYCFYGNASYILRLWLQTVFSRLGATADHLAYNSAIKSMREAVEWNYKDLKQI